MIEDKPVLILFPGAWGNKDETLVKWWFHHVIKHFQNTHRIVPIVYQGGSLEAYIQNALSQLASVPDGSVAICYSMGSQIARGVAKHRPNLFKKVAFLSGLEYFGIRVQTVLTGLRIGILPFLRLFVGLPLMFDTADQFRQLFFTKKDPETSLIEKFLREKIVPEPAWVIIRLSFFGMRRYMKPLSCPILAVIPQDDFFVHKATYAREQVERLEIPGTHGLLCYKEDRLSRQLERIKSWFEK